MAPTHLLIPAMAVAMVGAHGIASRSLSLADDPRLAALRTEMLRAGVDAWIVPPSDPHLSEYAHPYYERRAFISSFTGSAGVAVVTLSEALLWTDGRYFLQVRVRVTREETQKCCTQTSAPSTRPRCAAPQSIATAVIPLPYQTTNFPTTVNSLRHPTTLTLHPDPTTLPDNRTPRPPPPPTSLQAETQLGDDWKLMRGGRPGVPKLIEWLVQSLPKGANSPPP